MVSKMRLAPDQQLILAQILALPPHQLREHHPAAILEHREALEAHD